MLRATKIVATLGPASSDPAVLERLLLAGVDVVRLNFSHGKAEGHIALAKLVREVAASHPEVRAILMSSHVDDELAQELADAGIPFLAKPFSPQLLVNAVAGGPVKRKKRTPAKRAPATTARRPR